MKSFEIKMSKNNIGSSFIKLFYIFIFQFLLNCLQCSDKSVQILLPFNKSTIIESYDYVCLRHVLGGTFSFWIFLGLRVCIALYSFSDH